MVESPIVAVGFAEYYWKTNLLTMHFDLSIVVAETVEIWNLMMANKQQQKNEY